MNVAERITITVPDDLHKRLQEVKEKLNVSRICSRAIDEAIELEELKLRTDISDKEKAIERLRAEKKQEVSTKWKKKGFSEGLNDAQNTLSYYFLKQIALNYNEESRDKKEFPIVSFFRRKFRERYRKYSSDYEFEEEAYLEGWSEGVTHFWKEVKDEL
jgi:predicted transcriptional regulator